nr:immunoglobulin light chain junction region [Macaca mulatta]MPO06695.1 immunoglobulin light chain junction region [Macaca mulatta]MPO12988.1 immunoglobulin light chain junction region [Macaca mulatta]
CCSCTTSSTFIF